MSDPGGGGGGAAIQSNAQMRQVLAAYVRNAHTLTGPSRLEEQIGAGKYKLPSDVVLHRVGGPLDPAINGPLRRDNNAGYNNGHQVMDLNKQFWLQRERFMRQVHEHQFQSEKERLRERRLRQNSGPERSNHLSGEKIRLLRENQKKDAERHKLEPDRRSKDELKDSKKPAFKSPVSSAVPIMSSSDKSWSDLEETFVEGERISCFTVGGEPRLCLPQILNSVLERLSLKDINQACEELQIYCATCSAEQLQVLKESKVLPETAYQCGLITKSDAERLCSFLLDRNPPRVSARLGDPKSSPFSFKVEHDCFGKCEGLVLPEAYTGPSARCIECLQCEGLFSPKKFVTHAHDRVENRTCHWGFSSDNWRAYLRLSSSYTEEDQERQAKVFGDFKQRYTANGIKRSQDADHYDAQDVYSHSKRSKLDDVHPSSAGDTFPGGSYLGQAAFRPWSPGKGMGYPSYPFNIHHQPYSRTLSKDKQTDSRKYDVYSGSGMVADLSPQSVLPKKKYLEKEIERFPTLADEISTIKEALDGAPVHAKEAVLKILERLTQRVDRAERDRDLAVSRYRELHVKYEQLEDELAKKRGELRELLRQDFRPSVDQEEVKAESTFAELEEKETVSDNASERSTGSSLSKPENYSLSGLPKIVLKSPARVLEEFSSPHTKTSSGQTGQISEDLYHRPKEDENLKERMVKMEAELTALREELSRSQPAKLLAREKSPNTSALSVSSQKLGSNGANSSSPTPSPPSQSEDQPS